jgi:hypothetical protein
VFQVIVEERDTLDDAILDIVFESVGEGVLFGTSVEGWGVEEEEVTGAEGVEALGEGEKVRG